MAKQAKTLWGRVANFPWAAALAFVAIPSLWLWLTLFIRPPFLDGALKTANEQLQRGEGPGSVNTVFLEGMYYFYWWSGTAFVGTVAAIVIAVIVFEAGQIRGKLDDLAARAASPDEEASEASAEPSSSTAAA